MKMLCSHPEFVMTSNTISCVPDPVIPRVSWFTRSSTKIPQNHEITRYKKDNAGPSPEKPLDITVTLQVTRLTPFKIKNDFSFFYMLSTTNSQRSYIQRESWHRARLVTITKNTITVTLLYDYTKPNPNFQADFHFTLCMLTFFILKLTSNQP